MLWNKTSPVDKELNLVKKEEAKLRKKVLSSQELILKKSLEQKIPKKINDNLEAAFSKAFYVVFEKGTSVIEKTYNKNAVSKDHEVKDYAAKLHGRRKELKKISKGAKNNSMLNMTISTVEGVGLGALGIGLPDIVLFVGMLLKGVYETAIRYGFGYESTEERFLILKMMEASMSKGEDWEVLNEEVDIYLRHDIVCSKEALDKQIEKTAKAFAMDMLILKFIQGLPIVGMIGGLGNPVYYQKVMKYVQLKYRKKYLQNLKDKKY